MASTGDNAAGVTNNSSSTIFGNTALPTLGTSESDKSGSTLFGSTTATAGSSLFGSSAIDSSSNTTSAPSGGLFGSSSTAPVDSGTGSSFTFGASSSNTTSAPSGELFGSSSTAPADSGKDSSFTSGESCVKDLPASSTSKDEIKPTKDEKTTNSFGGCFGLDSSKTKENEPDKAADTPKEKPFSESTSISCFALPGTTTVGSSNVFDPNKIESTDPNYNSKLQSSLFASSSSRPVLTATSLSGPKDSQSEPMLDIDFSVTEQHNITELLDSWEIRINKKIDMFKRCAEKVSEVDRNLVLQSSNLNKLLNEHKQLLEKNEKMEASIKQMEEEQKTVISILETVEKSLQVQWNGYRNRSPNYNTIQNVTRQLQELSEQLSHATKTAEETSMVCQPEPLYTVAKVLSFHEASLLNLERQVDEIDNYIKGLEKL